MQQQQKDYLENVKNYLILLKEYHKKNKQTTETHVDTLILLYREDKRQSIFNAIFLFHDGLLRKLCDRIFKQYENHLYDSDFDDILSLCYGEFHRRIFHYEYPPRAPFSKYVKLYMKKWLNTYTKIIVRGNDKHVSIDKFLKSEQEENP